MQRALYANVPDARKPAHVTMSSSPRSHTGHVLAAATPPVPWHESPTTHAAEALVALTYQSLR